jgi:hypothetical protein
VWGQKVCQAGDERAPRHHLTDAQLAGAADEPGMDVGDESHGFEVSQRRIVCDALQNLEWRRPLSIEVDEHQRWPILARALESGIGCGRSADYDAEHFGRARDLRAKQQVISDYQDHHGILA